MSEKIAKKDFNGSEMSIREIVGLSMVVVAMLLMVMVLYLNPVSIENTVRGLHIFLIALGSAFVGTLILLGSR